MLIGFSLDFSALPKLSCSKTGSNLGERCSGQRGELWVNYYGWSWPSKMVGKLNGHHSEPAITRERQHFSKIHESNRNIFMWRSRSCLSCGVEVNAVPDDRMNERQNDFRNPSCRGLMNEWTDVRNPRLFIVLLTTQRCMKQLVLHTDVLAASIAASYR